MSRAVRKRGLAILSASASARWRRRNPLKAPDRAALALRLPLDALEEPGRRLREPAAIDGFVDTREHVRPNELAIGKNVLRQILDHLQRCALSVPNLPNVDDNVGEGSRAEASRLQGAAPPVTNEPVVDVRAEPPEVKCGCPLPSFPGSHSNARNQATSSSWGAAVFAKCFLIESRSNGQAANMNSIARQHHVLDSAAP